MMARKLTPEEVAKVNERAQEFLDRYKSVPEPEKRLDTGEKLSGPVGFRVVEDDDTAESDVED